MIELTNGCICCSINGELIPTVEKILDRPDKIDYLIVETTGLADPLPVAMTFAASNLRDKVRLDSIITLIDAENFDFEINTSSVAYSQILYGDILLLNKCDLVNEKQIRRIEQRIHEIKKEPRILKSINSEVGLQAIISVGLFETDKLENQNDHDTNVKDHSHDSHGHNHGHAHDHEHSDNNIEGFTSISFKSCEPFSLRKFQNFLDNQLSKNVFRAKGILWFMESERKHIFHLSGKRFSLDDDDWDHERSNKIVLIGKNLDKELLLHQLDSCRFDQIKKEAS